MQEFLTTDRLLFREINETDTADIVKWRSDEDVYKFFKYPHRITVEEHVSWFNNNYKNNNSRTDYICIEKSSGKKIGVFGLIHNGMDCEINYLLSPEAKHKGYAQEALKFFVQYAHSNFNSKRIMAEIHKDNMPSINLINRIGFQIESEEGSFIVYSMILEDS